MAVVTCKEEDDARNLRHADVQDYIEEFATTVAGCTVDSKTGSLRHGERAAKIMVVSINSWSVQDTVSLELLQDDSTVAIVIVDGHLEHPAKGMNVRKNAKVFVYTVDCVLRDKYERHKRTTTTPSSTPKSNFLVVDELDDDPVLFGRRTISYSEFPDDDNSPRCTTAAAAVVRRQ